MKKVLITGATGFVGKHLTDYLAAKKEFEIFGTSLSDSQTGDKIQIEKIDLTNFDSVSSLVNKIKPDFIYHLAALTSPAKSFDNPTSVILGNIQMQINLLRAVKDANLQNSRILIVSSGDVYGLVKSEDLPVSEQTELRPFNPYAVSKIAQDYMALQYSLTYKMNIVRVRPFNHTGPGQSSDFSISSFARQIARIEKGQQEPVLMVGNLDSKRDFSDVRDIVKGYLLLAEKGKISEVYNIGSGKSYFMKDLLKILLSFATKEIDVKEDHLKYRPVDVEDIYCNYSKINKLTGWVPEIRIEKTLQDTLDYWRSVV